LENRHSKAEAVTSVAGVFGGVLFVVTMLGLRVYAIHESHTGVAVASIIVALAPVALALVNRGKPGPD